MNEAEKLRQDNEENGFGYLIERSTESLLEAQETRRESYATLQGLIRVRKRRKLCHPEFVDYLNAVHDTDIPEDVRIKEICLEYHSPEMIDLQQIIIQYNDYRRCLHAYKNELRARELEDA